MIKRQTVIVIVFGNKDRHGFKKVMVIFHSVQKCVGGLTRGKLCQETSCPKT